VGGWDLEDFGGTLSEEFSDGGAGIAEVTVIDLQTLQVPLSQVVDSCTVDGLPNFIGILQQKRAEFTCNGTTNGGMYKPVLQGSSLDVAECLGRDFLVHHGITAVHRVGWFGIIVSTTTRRERELWIVL
jgi:hypothetical protein